MLVLIAFLVIAVLYLWHRIDKLESRLSHDEDDFAWRLEEVASQIPDDDASDIADVDDWPSRRAGRAEP